MTCALRISLSRCCRSLSPPAARQTKNVSAGTLADCGQQGSACGVFGGRMENRKTENEWIRAVGRNREEELTAGIDDVSGNVLRGNLWGNGDFWDDMLDLWEEE